MHQKRANASVVAVLVILLVIAGVIYLFWQNQLPLEPTEVEAVGTPVEVDVITE